MTQENANMPGRREAMRAALAVSAVSLAPPFLRQARGEQSVKIGFNDPLTGTYAALGNNELVGARLAVEQINAKGGILGREVELLVESSTSNSTSRPRMPPLALICSTARRAPTSSLLPSAA